MLIMRLCLHFLKANLHSLDFLNLQILIVPLYYLVFYRQLPIFVIFNPFFSLFRLLSEVFGGGTSLLALPEKVKLLLFQVLLGLIQAGFIKVQFQSALKGQSIMALQHLEL
jgi:hypothetical protein